MQIDADRCKVDADRHIRNLHFLGCLIGVLRLERNDGEGGRGEPQQGHPDHRYNDTITNHKWSF